MALATATQAENILAWAGVFHRKRAQRPLASFVLVNSVKSVYFTARLRVAGWALLGRRIQPATVPRGLLRV